ncbi:GAF domain-containing protein [Alcaligenaceae bacterium]|nr:GAF domain-containing protein [Alcaligenaceae bacterium]
MEMILSSAREITGADAGTLYMLEPDTSALRFANVQNDTLNVQFDSSSDGKNYSLIPLYYPDGSPDQRTVAACTVFHKSTINISDAYNELGFDFSGTLRFDKKTGYRSRSFLTIPLINHDNEVIAVLQLINKLDKSSKVITFDAADQEIAESLASQAAVALSNQQLVKELRALFDSFTRVIASAIDAKSPHTGAHCRRVPDATLMLAKAASGADFPGLEGFLMSDNDMDELQTAAWLHDCGKIVTPHHIMEKSTKLETIVDRINSISQRFDILVRDIEIAELKEQLHAARLGLPEPITYLSSMHPQLKELADEFTFLQRINIGTEFMTDSDIERVQAIAKRGWIGLNGQPCSLLSEDEVLNLCIRKGTLNTAERNIMEDHMVHTLAMLEQLPFPPNLQNVTEYALGHHERMDGTGYPRGLRKDQLSIPARIMGLTDVFEALTAHERPYKSPMPLSQALKIMGNMVENQHLDPDIFALFVHKQVYLDYAHKHLQPEQIDTVNFDTLPGLSSSAYAAAIL